jgi:hypothetical protein
MPENSEPGPGTVATPATNRVGGKSVLKIVLEVVLIGFGVFLGLMGDQWREQAQHRESAQASLRYFKTEIEANRKALAAVTEYHAKTAQGLQDFFKSDVPKTSANFKVDVHGIGPVFFERTAWDLALATQALSYLDSDLAFALSRVYTLQNGYAAQQQAIVQSTMYGRSWNQDFEGYFRSVLGYFNDLNYLDPTLMRAYDEVLPKLDRALGSAAASP